MKRIILFISCVLSIFGCSSDDTSEPINNLENVTNPKYTLKEKNEPNDLVYTQEYSIDEQGKITSESYTNFYNPQFSYLSTFEYNGKGQVIKEIRDGSTNFTITWTNNFAEVYNMQNQKIAEFNFDGERLNEYKTEFNTNNVRIRKLNYDSNNNIISVENEEEIFVEFLDYELPKRNPLNLIQSIGILRIDYNPFFKNIFRTEKVYPFEGDDFSQPLTFYEYFYEFDSENRVYQIEDEKSLIYTSEFEYE
ncbi:hypothetical protein [Cellulophaga tyrosinoxydans]|uniref:Uncharacterized protein n=1 Tax=Cellulophaga tyrosinoxydans TaxID=504486 RepID=A0A1W2CV36_9FLAO|nr:hypothetical protein [Cellulophaga tyrosinoxydans]SMC88588.1 hypothetical protein SAMN05660703_3212 [Cellulophaga tyrosinoxydans]